MTRTTGSVPDARSTTRPSSPSFASAARTSCQIRSAPSSADRSAGTATSFCGNGRTRSTTPGHREVEPIEHAEQHERRREPVAGRVVLEVDHVAGLLSAERRAGLEHPLEHVAVADVGHLDLDPVLAHEPVEPEVGHRRDDDPVARQRAVAAAVDRERRDDRVAVRRCRPSASTARQRSASPSKAIPHSAPRVLHRPRERVEVGGADPGVDVPAVGLGADQRVDRAAQRANSARRGRGRRRSRSRRTHRAVAAHAVAVGLRQPVDVAPARRPRPARPARRRARALEPIAASMSASAASGSLRPSAPRNLMPLSCVRVVRRRDDAAQLGPEPADEHRHAGRRDDPGRERDAAARDDPLDEGLLERRARLARVAAEDDRCSPARRPPPPRRRGRAPGRRSGRRRRLPRTPSVPNSLRSAVKSRDQRFENWGRLRAFLRPAFLRSTWRASRVRNPCRFRSPRRLASASMSAFEIPWRSAPAWPEMPPPSMRARTS